MTMLFSLGGKYLLLYLAVMAVALHCTDGRKMKREVGVEHVGTVIIGAGASGMAAGCRLMERGYNDFLILEAQDRIGGRIHSVPFGNGTLDLGAQWIHGEEGNVVNEMAVDLDLVYRSHGVTTKGIIYKSNGEVFPHDTHDFLMDFLKEVGELVPGNSTKSQGEFYTEKYWPRVNPRIEQGAISRADAESLLKVAELMANSLEASPSWFETAATSEYEDYEGNFNVVWKSGGYSTLFDILTKKLPNPAKQLKIDDKIRLNKAVTKVDWSSGGVTVSCADGTQVTADRVLVTVSLNVLKATADDMFHPALPPSNLKAIKALGMNTVDKIYLEFPYRWWTPGTNAVVLSWLKEDSAQLPEELRWTSSLFAFSSVDNFPKNLLCGWVVGKGADDMEGYSDEKVLRDVTNMLKRFAGSSIDVPEVISMKRTKWFSNPFIRGSYSYSTVTSQNMNIQRRDLAAPVLTNNKPIIMFAGEATNDKHHSTAHGAVETGFREADRILSLM